MQWLTENWTWLLFGGGFVALHLVGHRAGVGCCGGGHGRESAAKGSGASCCAKPAKDPAATDAPADSAGKERA